MRVALELSDNIKSSKTGEIVIEISLSWKVAHFYNNKTLKVYLWALEACLPWSLCKEGRRP